MELVTGGVSYSLPAQYVDINAIARELQSDGSNLQEIKMAVEITSPSTETLQFVESTARSGRFTLVAPPIEFTVKATYGGKTVEVERFGGYVERRIVIPDDINPRGVTGVVIQPDGTARHVPTKIVRENGKYVAVIQSRTNSLYAVVSHSKTFQDAERHWAAAAINDMASRKIVNGANEQTFHPDQEITRAEFAAIVI